MFTSASQGGLLSIFSSCGSKPLELWEAEVKNGHINRPTDSEIGSIVLEIGGSNVSTTYITCPKKGSQKLGITLPYMVILAKNLKKKFSFEVTIVDGTGMRRRFRISNFQSKPQIQPFGASVPISLFPGWNKIQVNLAEYTSRSFNTQFAEVTNVKINANIRLKRIYFTKILRSDDELPPEYRLHKPMKHIKRNLKGADAGKENKQQQESVETSTKEIIDGKLGAKSPSQTALASNGSLISQTITIKVEEAEDTTEIKSELISNLLAAGELPEETKSTSVEALAGKTTSVDTPATETLAVGPTVEPVEGLPIEISATGVPDEGLPIELSATGEPVEGLAIEATVAPTQEEIAPVPTEPAPTEPTTAESPGPATTVASEPATEGGALSD